MVRTQPAVLVGAVWLVRLGMRRSMELLPLIRARTIPSVESMMNPTRNTLSQRRDEGPMNNPRLWQITSRALRRKIGSFAGKAE